MTPPAALRRALKNLKAGGSPARAAGAKAYFKKFEPIYLFGVAVPQVRSLARALSAEVKGTWTVRDAIAFADLAVRRRETEAKWTGFFLLGRYARDFPDDLARTIGRWIAAGRCDNWALIDALSAEVIAPLLRRHPSLLPVVTGWHTSENRWLRRASVVPLVPFVRKGEILTPAYSVVASLFGDTEDLTHKACGWLLREAGKTNPRRLAAFLMRHGPAVPRTTLRYAIERFPAAERARLLAATRGTRS
jgi:3-methyladenine DNA glycosylase AlkD